MAYAVGALPAGKYERITRLEMTWEVGAAPRHVLAVANYKAPEQRGVASYEWNTKVTMWERFRWLEVGGVSEFCDCETDDGRLLLGAAVWFTGSFETKSLLFEFDDESQQFRVVQTLATLGAPDLECFGAGGDGVAEHAGTIEYEP